MNDRPKRSAEYSTGSLDGRPIIFGEVLFDQFPDGSSVLGGAPFNVAWHLQGFGVAPLFLSCVGDDEPGRRVRHAMHDWGMDAEGLQTDPSHPTGTVKVNFAQGGHTFDILSDQAYDHIDIAFAQAVSRQIDCALLYHGTLIMRTAVTRDALQGLLADSGLPAFVDINLRDPWWRVEDLPAVFDRARWAKVNDDELLLTGSRLGVKAEGLEETAKRFRSAFDIDLLIVTRGAEGAIALGPMDELQSVLPPCDVDVVDTVGAGDAFASVILLGLMRGWSLGSMLSRAQEFASRICGQRGATSFDSGLYRRLMDDWRDPSDER